MQDSFEKPGGLSDEVRKDKSLPQEGKQSPWGTVSTQVFFPSLPLVSGLD